jgi:hypothetical protein
MPIWSTDKLTEFVFYDLVCYTEGMFIEILL